MNVIDRTEMMDEISKLHERISELETKILLIENKQEIHKDILNSMIDVMKSFFKGTNGTN